MKSLSFIRNFGYIRQGNARDATFKCLHRYTEKPICAIPCNGEDDLCLYNVDEDIHLCSQKFPIYLLVSTIVILILVGSVFGEIVFRLDFDTTGQDEWGPHLNMTQILDEICRSDYDKDLFESLFNRAHSEGSIRNLILTLDSKFKSPSFELADIFQTIYNLELRLHEDNVIACELCLKEHLGTDYLAMRFLDYVEYGFFIRIKLHCSGFLNQWININCESKDFIITTLTLISNVVLYYLDLIRDIGFIFFVGQLVSKGINNFAFQLQVTLILIIIINELNKFQWAIAIKNNLNVSYFGFAIIIFTLPLMPFTLLYIIAKLSYKNMVQQRSKCLPEISLHSKIMEITKILNGMKRNENSLENFPQLVIVCAIIGIASSPTTPITAVVQIVDPKSPILYMTAILSLSTIIRSSVGQVKASKNGFLPFKGVLLYVLYMTICVCSRLIAVLLYLAPSLGLLPILYHWKLGSIGVALRASRRSLIYDEPGAGNTMYFKDKWLLTPDIQYYVGFTYEYYAIALIILALSQILLTFIKHSKNANKSVAFRIALDSLLCPTIERTFSIITFALGNVTLLFPMCILKHYMAK